MSATKNLIGGVAGSALAFAPFATATKNDAGRPEDPTKASIAVVSTATNTPAVVFNAITDDEYSVEPPEAALKVNSRSA